MRYRHVTQGMSRLKDAVSGLELHLAEQEFIQMAGDSHLVLGMDTCNELNIIKDVIHGASLDEKKFSSTGWSMTRTTSTLWSTMIIITAIRLSCTLLTFVK